MANSRKTTKKVKELKQTHGKDEASPKSTTLDQIWGDTGLSKYKTMEITEYRGSLKGMNKTDLQRHASEVGIIPVDNRDILVKRLEGEFNKYVANYRVPQVKSNPRILSQEAKDILSEGR